MVFVVLRRLGVFATTVVVASVVTFLMLSILPGNAARIALGVQASEADVAAQATAMGLDRPAIVRYLDWFGHVLIGDFGTSTVSRQAIGPEITDALGITVILVLTSVVLALLFAIPFGILTAVRQRKPDGAILSGISQIGVAVPGFLAGMLLVTVFAVTLRWLPAGGWVDPGEDFGGFLEHLILPAIALGSVQGAVLSRYVRSSVLEVMREDFIRTARAKGLGAGPALFRHGLRNAAVPVMTVLGLQIATLLVGAVVIERVFSIPGLGSLLLDKVALRDLPAVQGIVLVLVVFVLALNFLVDLAFTLVDPRLRSAA
ncbi:ABC transporter permease [Cryobacterium sp. TMT1-3]|uniref:ABC transporter permease n=1 Tax=Cryobacterium luteum TaxID=1424661 RepID=A0A1H8ER30_9MICO|nr:MULTISPECIES: ABC transporter permease [Cryobacterium]TFB85770.1 ABC transporter permease [Cryobacterium luteum]TFC31393.1 ABC transporter permease [Cryobacterium sp. TMT1-3]SEN21892.1 peptide/nickel transport system permease protein [Cryobacterium luteum]